MPEHDFIACRGELISIRNGIEIWSVIHKPAVIHDPPITVRLEKRGKNGKYFTYTFHPVETAALLGLMSQGKTDDEIYRESGYGRALIDAVLPELRDFIRKREVKNGGITRRKRPANRRGNATARKNTHRRSR